MAIVNMVRKRLFTKTLYNMLEWTDSTCTLQHGKTKKQYLLALSYFCKLHTPPPPSKIAESKNAPAFINCKYASYFHMNPIVSKRNLLWDIIQFLKHCVPSGRWSIGAAIFTYLEKYLSHILHSPKATPTTHISLASNYDATCLHFLLAEYSHSTHNIHI